MCRKVAILNTECPIKDLNALEHQLPNESTLGCIRFERATLQDLLNLPRDFYKSKIQPRQIFIIQGLNFYEDNDMKSVRELVEERSAALEQLTQSESLSLGKEDQGFGIFDFEPEKDTIELAEDVPNTCAPLIQDSADADPSGLTPDQLGKVLRMSSDKIVISPKKAIFHPAGTSFVGRMPGRIGKKDSLLTSPLANYENRRPSPTNRINPNAADAGADKPRNFAQNSCRSKEPSILSKIQDHDMPFAMDDDF